MENKPDKDKIVYSEEPNGQPVEEKVVYKSIDETIAKIDDGFAKTKSMKMTLGDKIKLTLVAGTMIAVGAVGGYIGRGISPPTNYSVKSIENKLHLVGKGIDLPITEQDGFAQVGDFNYRFQRVKKELSDASKEPYLNNIVIAGLKNASLSSEAQALVVTRAEEIVYSSPEAANRLLFASINTLSVSEYSQSNKDDIAEAFRALAEQQPTLYEGMGPNFKKYVEDKSYGMAGERLLKDVKKVGRAIGETDTYKGLEQQAEELSEKAKEKVKEFSIERLQDSYQSLKKKILEGK